MILDATGDPTNGKAELDEQLTRAYATEARLIKEALDLQDLYVDPTDALRGPSGEMWQELTGKEGTKAASGFRDERQLREAREVSRELLFTNEFALNGIENRISYTVGTGHAYTAVPRKGAEAADELVERVQEIIDQFIEVNKWHRRQQEIMRRRDRDGEAFLRLFEIDGALVVRFIEPGQVFCPQAYQGTDKCTFGIETNPEDVEEVLIYYVDDEPIPADQIQHRKLGVDSNVKRGIPLFYPVQKLLKRVDQLQENMDRVAGIQTAIAMIRKHQAATKATVESYRTALSQYKIRDDSTATTRYLSQYQPGTIIDAPAGTEYDFPASGIDASRFVAIKQSALRAVASRLVMPEFMLTSDASNANYSSTLVAEGPAVKMFQRLQAEQEEDDLELIWRAVGLAGGIPEEIKQLVEIEVGKPTVMTRDALTEAQTNEIYERMGIKSHQTISGEIGVDYEQEQSNIDEQRERKDTSEFPPLLEPGAVAELEEPDEEEEEESPEPVAAEEHQQLMIPPYQVIREQSPIITPAPSVNVEPQTIIVQPPNIEVHPPIIEVHPPNVNVTIEPQDVNVTAQPPEVNVTVQPADVTIEKQERPKSAKITHPDGTQSDVEIE